MFSSSFWGNPHNPPASLSLRKATYLWNGVDKPKRNGLWDLLFLEASALTFSEEKIETTDSEFVSGDIIQRVNDDSCKPAGNQPMDSGLAPVPPDSDGTRPRDCHSSSAA